jgi:SOS-response transcriptional repressor LexA
VVGKWQGGRRIAQFYEELGLKRAEFAKILGVSYDRLLSYESGRTEPSPSFFERISQQFPALDLNWLVTGRPVGQSQSRIPILARIPAGLPSASINDEVIGHLDLISGQSNQFGLEVHGMSMHPEVQEGDIAICSPNAPVVTGSLCAVATLDYEYTLKRIRIQSDGYELIASNPDFSPIFLAKSKIERIVRVVRLVRELQR